MKKNSNKILMSIFKYYAFLAEINQSCDEIMNFVEEIIWLGMVICKQNIIVFYII